MRTSLPAPARCDTLTGIKVFRQIVDSGSFVAAADRMDMSVFTIRAVSAGHLPGTQCTRFADSL
jgi:hypothetical protein